MAVGRGGSTAKTSLGFLIYGAQGMWKSSLALEMLKFNREDGKPFRVLFIDAEQGSVDSYLDEYEQEGIDLRNLYLVYTQSLSEVKDFIEKASKYEEFYVYDEEGNETEEVYLDADGQPFRPDAIVVDGATLLFIARQQGLTEFSKLRATVRARQKEMTGLEKQVSIQGSALEIKDWNTLKFDGQSLILALLNSGKHFAVTAREEDEKDRIKGASGQFESVPTGRKIPSGFKDLVYNVKTVIHTFKDDDGVIKGVVENKDRTKVYPQDHILVEPTLTDWKVVVEKNKGKKTLNNSNTLDGAVLRELEDAEEKDMTFDKSLGVNDPQETKDPETVEEYISAIQSAISSLAPMQKTKLQQRIVKAGLPKAYMKLDDLDILKEYHALVSQK